MGCNCGGAKTVSNTRWVYTSPSGQQKVYKTEVEAKAAKIRGGGGTITTTQAA